ncbi:glycosyltransferase family 2 protein [Xylophilus sp. GOD-11R]|uniref:glycosyltransferase family 2 protein n=1 Tax=Xylophilus sp. GOD-11R TaxID=3089814 RepID=UPI00298CC7E0|nr:glycosyltransferase family 2 protein [Xylophilus sp. GOD-11R]WPB56348.1 glycosyltransferase family 2 protein [Xylophilus sp. GOD-11R]
MNPTTAALPRIAVLLPCYNEAGAIGQVIRDCRAALPEAVIHVFDNVSTDPTAVVARAHQARVITVPLRGKGNVVRRMFADVEADIYLLVDGDATYDVSGARRLIEHFVDNGLDMLVGARVEHEPDARAYRPGHRWGNRALSSAVGQVFGGEFSDMLSGLRVFSRRYVKSFPATSRGFEIETELTIHALELRMPWSELPVAYFERPAGTHSKLSTFRDGWRILRTVARLFSSERPMIFFSLVGALLAIASLVLAAPVVMGYWQTGLVPRLPTAVLSVGVMLAGMLSLVCGLVLHTVTLGRQEAKRLAYLAQPLWRRDGP